MNNSISSNKDLDFLRSKNDKSAKFEYKSYMAQQNILDQMKNFLRSEKQKLSSLQWNRLDNIITDFESTIRYKN